MYGVAPVKKIISIRYIPAHRTNKLSPSAMVYHSHAFSEPIEYHTKIPANRFLQIPTPTDKRVPGYSSPTHCIGVLTTNTVGGR